MALLEAKGLNKAFGSVVAADNISVSIKEQEVIGIIGANGAGKTTFVNMVTGYLKPDQGQILYQGNDITPRSPREITRLGISRSFQVPQVFLSMSVFDNLLIALGVAEEGTISLWHPLRRPDLMEAADEIINRYGIADYRDQEAGLLPQGVRKLLDVGMAMASNPRVVLLDEPTSGVSIDEKFGIMDVVMGALQDTGVTILFVEHDMDIIGRYSKRVLAFADGTILSEGSPDAVLKDEQVKKYVIGEELHRTAPHDLGGDNA